MIDLIRLFEKNNKINGPTEQRNRSMKDYQGHEPKEPFNDNAGLPNQHSIKDYHNDIYKP